MATQADKTHIWHGIKARVGRDRGYVCTRYYNIYSSPRVLQCVRLESPNALIDE